MGVSEGQLLAGKYRVERVLGQGGMGVVVAAHHAVLDQVVAIKFLLPEALGSAESVARFEREARAAVKIQSEHVARVTDVGRLDTGAPYMVMELLRGQDLAAVLQEKGPLPLQDVTDYLLQAGEAIAEAHGLGIVHRDLKPPNLFLTKRADGSECVKVLDFGISKVTNTSKSGDKGMTSTTAVMGSPLYMSPEQLMSARDVDMRTDIWALGVICFELLTGQLPFDGDTLPQLCMAISLSPPRSLRAYRPELPQEAEAMILRCLSKDPTKRFPTVAALAAELVKYAPRHASLSAERIERLARVAGFSASAPALPLPAAAAAALTPPIATVAEFVRTGSAGAPRKRRVVLLATAVLLVAGVGVAFVLGRHAPEALSHESLPSAPSHTAAVSGVPATETALPSEPPPAPQLAPVATSVAGVETASPAAATGLPSASLRSAVSHSVSAKAQHRSANPPAPSKPLSPSTRVETPAVPFSKPAPTVAVAPSSPAPAVVPVPRSRL